MRALVCRQGAFSQLVDLGSDTEQSPRNHVGHGIVGTICASAAMFRSGTAMSFVRQKAKSYGLQLVIEGALSEEEMSAAVQWGVEESDGVERRSAEVRLDAFVNAPPRIGVVTMFDEDALSLDHEIALPHVGEYKVKTGQVVQTYYDTVPALCRMPTLTTLCRQAEPFAEGCDAIYTSAFGGIPFAMALSIRLGLPCFVVDLLFGDVVPNTHVDGFVPQRAFLVDDFATTGGTMGTCVEHLHAIGGDVSSILSVAAIFPNVDVKGLELQALLFPKSQGSSAPAKANQ